MLSYDFLELYQLDEIDFNFVWRRESKKDLVPELAPISSFIAIYFFW